MLNLRATLAMGTAVLFAIAPVAAWAEDTGPEYKTVVLWPEGAPGALGKDEKDQPRLTIHLPAQGKATGAGVVVNPGGGYHGLASDYEGLQVAQELNRHGIAAFVLRYRLLPEYQPSLALEDGKRAIRYVRYHAKDFGLSETRIGMSGFSAGGHLTTAVGTRFDAGDREAKDPIDRVSSRPDFIAPIYAAISRDLLKFDMGDWATTDTLVTPETPPAFLIQTHEDTLVSPLNSIRFYEALVAAKVSAELHIFQVGPHGLGLGSGDPQYGQWPALFVQWLQRNKFLTDAPRVAVSGTVTLDGAPLFWGSVTLLPEDPRLPVAVTQIGPNSKGKFNIDEAHGPCPGKYRVQAIRVASDKVKPMSFGYSLDDAEKYMLPGVVEISAASSPLEIALTSH